MSARPLHLGRRGAVYFVRFRIPAALVSALGRTDLQRSLRTKDYDLARHRCREAAIWFPQIVGWLLEMTSPTRAHLEEAARLYFDQLCGEVDQPRALPAENFDAEMAFQREETQAQIGQIDMALRTNDFSVRAQAQAENIFRKVGLELSEFDDRARLQAVSYVMRAERQQMVYLLHKLTSPVHEFQPDDALFQSETERRSALAGKSEQIATATASRRSDVSARLARPDLSLQRAISLYIEFQTKKGWQGSMKDEALRVLHWLEEEIDNATPLETITFDQMREFRDCLMDLGSGAQGRKLPLRQRLAHNDGRLKFATRERYWSSIRAFFAYFQSEYRLADPTEGLLFQGGRNEEKRSPEPFSTEETRRFLKTPLFAGYQSPKRLLSPGTLEVRDGYWWSAILMMFGGLRASDAVQLLPSDFVFNDEVPHLIIQPGMLPEGVPKRSKFGQRMHKVPLHPTLIQLGVREFVERRAKQAPNKRLLYEISLGGSRMSGGMTKFWSRYLTKFDLFKPGRSTHVHRHTVTARLRSAHVHNEDIGAVLGHRNTTTTAGYGGDQDLPRKLATLTKLDYGFDVVAALGGAYDPKRHR